MSEWEIRKRLQEIRSELDLVRKGVRKVLLPTALGAGLALSGCSDDATPIIDAMHADAGRDAQVTDTMTSDSATTDAPADSQTSADSSADTSVATDTTSKPEFMPPPPYMAPDTEPLYDSFSENHRRQA